MPSSHGSPLPAAESHLRIESGVDSRRGLNRAVNQDNYVIDADERFFVIADGVGGHAGGDVASSMACELLRPLLSRVFQATGPSQVIMEELDVVLRRTHEAIVQRQEQEPRMHSMATSLVLGLIRHRRLFLASIGDSRVYLFREGQCRLLTRDHTIAEGLIDAGCLSEDQARQYPLGAVVYNVLGGQGCVGAADQRQVKLEAGDRIVFATDGLSDWVSDEEMGDVVSQYFHADQAARVLTDLAASKGSRDDITCVVVYLSPSTRNAGLGMRHAELDADCH